MASSAVEDDLQAIYTLADENGHIAPPGWPSLSFSAPVVSKMVGRARRSFEHEAGFLDYLDGTVRTLRPDCGHMVWMAL